MASNSLIPPYIQTNANNLSYGLGGEVPPEIALEEQALNRKQQIANLLLQRGMQSPQGQMAGRFYVAPSPMQGVAQLANVLAGGYITHRNDEARKGLAEKNRSMTADAIQAYIQKTSPQPVEQEAFGPGAPVEHPYSISGEMSVQGMFPGADPRTLPHTFDIDELQPPTPQPVTYRRDNGNMPMWAGPYEGSDSDGYKSPFQQIPEGLSKIAQAFMPEQKAAQTGPRPYDEGPMVFAPWSEQGVTRTEGPRPTNTVMQPPTADSKRQALIEAMTSTIPGLRNFAQLQAQQDMQRTEHEAQRDFQAQQNLDNRAFMGEQKQLDRENRLATSEAQLNQALMLGLITKEQKDQMMAMTEQANKDRTAYQQGQLDLQKQIAGQTASHNKAMEDIHRQQLNQGKVPAGYRATTSGNLEAIPGGPADTKLQGALNQDTAILQSSIADMDRLAESANQILQHPGLAGITGVRGAIPDIPGTDAADARALLNKLKSQVGFSVLQNMRNNSKTGGALGNVSDSEGKRLENNLASVESAQSLDQMKKELRGIITYAEGAKDRYRDAYNLKHKGFEPPASAKPAPAPTNQQGWKLMQDKNGTKAYVSPDGKQFEEVP